MTTAPIKVDWSGPIAILGISNPPLNLLTTGFFRELRTRLSHLAERPHLRALIVSGVNDTPFSAGSDMREFERLGSNAVEEKVLIENLALADLEDFPVPTIAAIAGYALGGGLELALSCDLRIAESDARLGFPEPHIGGLASNGAQRITKLLGPARANQMLLLAEEVDGDEAHDMGLVNWTAESGSATERAEEIAQRIAHLAPLSVRLAKSLVRQTVEGSSRPFLESVRAQEQIFDSDDLSEGVKAFFEKRDPEFTTGGSE